MLLDKYFTKNGLSEFEILDKDDLEVLKSAGSVGHWVVVDVALARTFSSLLQRQVKKYLTASRTSGFASDNANVTLDCIDPKYLISCRKSRQTLISEASSMPRYLATPFPFTTYQAK